MPFLYIAIYKNMQGTNPMIYHSPNFTFPTFSAIKLFLITTLLPLESFFLAIELILTSFKTSLTDYLYT